ncbi:5-dehydro-2-deoxygluconokinase [Rudaeicoccus suwonensis]|uniref:5-dehydro-2-deoxygluconokinase n=1 Tax=Rudaeicoccus suwonensis TaxID=657409 RepID=UPI001BA9D6A0|nr:5-dehydro-2-deoxygluconokinase [Rudaeicoccus suwonensis]
MSCTPDVLTIGRTGVDIYPEQVGVRLEDVTTFGKFLGGTATNVAVAVVRLGRSAAVVTRTGDDPFGRFIHRSLRDFGVDDGAVSAVPDLPTPVTFCEMFPPDEFPLYFYRFPVAPDLMIRADELPEREIREAPIYWSTLTGMCTEPSRAAHLRAWQLRGRRSHTVLDLDYRPMFWQSPDDAGEAARAALPQCTIAVGNREECTVATGEDDPVAAARTMLDLGVQIAIVKQGPEGVLAMSGTECHVVAPIRVDVVNGLGAGDAFGGALCVGLLEGRSLRETVCRANAAGAIVAGRVECSSAMPSGPELDLFLQTRGV